MARTRTVIVCGLYFLAAAPTTWGVCQFQNDEIVNPFEAGCGDVILTYTDSDATGNNIALGYPVPIPVDSLTPVDGFRTYDSLFERHQSLLTMHDEVDGEIVGETVAGRDIWAYRLGDDDSTTAEGFAEGAVLVNGGIHAREWQTPEAVTGLMEVLVEGKVDGGFGQFLIENLTTVLLPVNNVDGFLQTQRFADRTTADREQPRDGRMRRKSMRNPQTQGAIDEDLATVGDNFWGIDLNRNSVDGFGQGGGSSGSETSLIYRGASPASEPEIAALQSAATLAPVARLRFFSDTHSFGQVYLAPTTGNARRNSITAQLAARMRAASMRGYAFGPAAAGSPGIGTTADYFAFTHSVPSWTMELEPANGGQDYGGLATHGHSGFVLPANEAARMREDVARMYLLGFYRQAGPPAVLAAQIRDLDSDQVVYEAAWQQSSATARTLAASTNLPMVPGRDYRLWVAFNKPMRVRDAGDVVAYRGQASGASVGTVTLEFPDLTGQDLTLAVAGGDAWLATPGGSPDGFLRYTDDAFAVNFTLPANLPVTASTAAVLSLSVRDLADMALDANPATAADWADGHWVRLEDALNAENDVGGIDCSFKPFAAPQDGAAPPAGEVVCAAATPPPPPPPPAPPPPEGGGGGGPFDWAVAALACGLLGRRRSSAHCRVREPRRAGPQA